MDGKLTFDWADSVSHPDLVSKIDWNAATNKYTDCDPSCTLLLQAADAPTLDNSASAVILLQTTHSSSNGNRYFVMEHRGADYDAPILLIHWTDIKPTWGPTGLYGNTVLTDCNPQTITWDDAGCSLGQHIELDTGDESASIKVWVYVYSALDDGKLKVTLSTNGVAAVPPTPPPPPAPPPSPPGIFMGYSNYPCACSEVVLTRGNYLDGTYSLIFNPGFANNNGKPVFQAGSGKYLYSLWNQYWIVGDDYTASSANQLTASGVDCPTDLTAWSVTCSIPLPPAAPSPSPFPPNPPTPPRRPPYRPRRLASSWVTSGTARARRLS